MPSQIAGQWNRAVPASIDDWRRSLVLVAIGAFALLLGVLLYLTDRPAAHAVLIPSVPALASGGRLFGVIGQWMPTFVHTFAFSLFTAAALPWCSTPRYGSCVAWCAVNVAFEIGQHRHIGPLLAEALTEHLGRSPLPRALANFFARGTFDSGDIAAAFVGAFAAAAVLYIVQPGRERPYAR